MTFKEKYADFTKTTYVPIYSQPWWLDAICGNNNWDVWLYESKGEIWAAMPYYKEKRGKYLYITKAALTQNNGIVFRYPAGISNIKKQAFEEKIIDSACCYIQSLGVDVYEQQYQYSFENYLPFFWNGYNAIPRYTYVIDQTSIDVAWKAVSSKYRNKIKKGSNNGNLTTLKDYQLFYNEHEKIFKKQGLNCPFSFKVWERLYLTAVAHNQGRIMAYKDELGNILSLIFLVWDDKSVYQLLGGSIPEYQHLDTYDALIWNAICEAIQQKKKYDFEGSMIKQISKSFREFGGVPKQYFRIRKVFDKSIIEKEANEKILQLEKE